MNSDLTFLYHRLIFRNGKNIYMTPGCKEFLHLEFESVEEFSWQDLLLLISLDEGKQLERKVMELHSGKVVDPVVCMFDSIPGIKPMELIIFLDEILYYGQNATQVTLLKNDSFISKGDRFQRESEVMRDVLAALAGADNLQKALEVILLNLHDIIQYDRAGLILADEDKRFVITQKEGKNTEEISRKFLDEDPIVREIISEKVVQIITDVQLDRRFDNWLDMEAVHGWLAAPLIVQNDVIGILTLGSLQVAAYSQEDAELMRIFAGQIAQVLEKAWAREQRTSRNKELEVISSISLALGRAESRENTLFDIVKRVTNFFAAMKGYFLLPDQTCTLLKIEVSADDTLIGEKQSIGNDLFGKAFQEGDINGLDNIPEFLNNNPSEFFQVVFAGANSAIVIPLFYDENVFGLLCFTFLDRRWFSDDRMRLANAVAGIAGASIHRAVVLNALERQVELRTQHLSTLYDINAVASRPLELRQILDHILEITIDSMQSSLGSIHFLDEEHRTLTLFTEKFLSSTKKEGFEIISLQDKFWQALLTSSNPVVVQDLRNDISIPVEIRRMQDEYINAYLAVPIRTKGRVFGLLSIFCQSVTDYAIEDFTLFMTISDQIGGSIERANLMKQAQMAAVVDERQRMARELHDSVTQLLYSQVLFTGASLKRLNQGNQEQAIQHLHRINEAALQALKEMRLLIYQLQPSEYLRDGLVRALEKRLDAVEKRSGIEALIQLECPIEIDSSQELMLYRIAEEALNNTLKHAHATKVAIRMGKNKGHLFLEVWDNGVGFCLYEKKQEGGMGLKNMRKRASELGGILSIDTKPNEGTKVFVELNTYLEEG